MLWLLERIEDLQYDAVMALLPRISAERRERVLRIQDKSTQIQSVAAELLLRYALREEYGIKALPKIELGENGKPFFFDNPQICFNLSHCKTAAACGLDALPVGVDVQETGCLRGERRTAELLYHLPREKTDPAGSAQTEEEIHSLLWVLHSEERAWVLSGASADERERRFLTVWTYKEAYGKAKGIGILYELDQFNFLPCIEGASQYGLRFLSWFRKDTVLTLCAQTPLDLQVVSIHHLIASDL